MLNPVKVPMIKIKKGLDLPIKGSPKQEILETKTTSHVAVIGADFNGMKPTMKVAVGDQVQKGQILFSDKKNEGVVFTSPVSGKVVEINRGEKRFFQSMTIERNGDEKVAFTNFNGKALDQLSRDEIVNLLVESGEWTAFQTRPFSKSPAVDSKPHALFINGMDSKPLAAWPELWISKHKQDFVDGVNLLSKLTEGNTFVCLKEGNQLKLDIPSADVKVETFSGPHPAGNSGTHIHFLSPASMDKTVWSINYQDVIAIAKLFKTGEIFTERMISIAGPEATSPKVITTHRGAKISDLVEGEKSSKDLRLISGSVLGGRKAEGPYDYLGRFHYQASIIEEDTEREFLGWQSPGFNKYSVTKAFLSAFIPGKKFNMTSSANGSLRAIVPIGSYEKVMPMDILSTHLLRALMSGDTDMAQKLGALELDEEDVALWTFVDPSKNEFGPVLRQTLETIEKEG